MRPGPVSSRRARPSAPILTRPCRPAPRSSAFLVTPHIGSRSTWKLPFRDTERRINLHLLHAARAAVKTGRTPTGKPLGFKLPSDAAAKVEAMWVDAKLWWRAYGRQAEEQREAGERWRLRRLHHRLHLHLHHLHRLTTTTSLTAGERKKKEKEVAALRAKAYTEAELEKMGVSELKKLLRAKGARDVGKVSEKETPATPPTSTSSIRTSTSTSSSTTSSSTSSRCRCRRRPSSSQSFLGWPSTRPTPQPT